MPNHTVTPRPRRAAGVAGALGIAAALLGVAAGCAPDAAPTAPAPSARAAPPLFAGDPFTGDRNELTRLVTYLFVADRPDALAEVEVITAADSGTAAACAGTANLLDRTFRNYRAYRLYGQVDNNGLDLTFPLPVVQLLVRRLSLNCSRLASPNGVPDATLQPGGAAGVITVRAGGTVETIPGPGGQAGVRVQPGTFDQDVVLYLVPQPPLQLPTSLPQSAPYYEIFVVPDQPRPYRFPVALGFVVNWPDGPPSDHLVVGHNAPGRGMELLQPTCLTTPQSGVGTWGGPLYLRPPGGCPGAAASAAPSAPAASAAPADAAAPLGPMFATTAVRGTTGTYGGSVDSFSPFGLVSIFQAGVNPNAGVTFGAVACTDAGRAVPYTVASASDLAVSYQEVNARGAVVTARTLLYLRGTASGGATAGQVRVTNAATTRVRFFYGATLFRTVEAALPGCAP